MAYRAVDETALGEETTPFDRAAEPARQQPLPFPWQLIRTIDSADFAHPAELHFAGLLSFYRVRWSYEPTTFSLDYAPDGRPSEMFTPDFYLPDHRLYIELTTMRQRLVTRKNRKIRRLRELYPGVRIKLLYRRDYERLVDAYRGARLADCCVPGDILFDADQIAGRIDVLAAAIKTADDRARMRPLDLSDRRPPIRASFLDPEGCVSAPPEIFDRNSQPCNLLVVAVDRGAAVFFDHLTAALDVAGLDYAVDRVNLSRYGPAFGPRRVRIGRGPRQPIVGRRILLVTDVVSTGLSLAYLSWWLKQRGAASVEICALLDRRSARLIDLPIDHAGFEAPNELLVGFGLSLRRQFRDLPYIASVVSGVESR